MNKALEKGGNMNYNELEQFIVERYDAEEEFQHIFRFPNNFGASVITNQFSYGLELAEIIFNGPENDDWDFYDHDDEAPFGGIHGHLTEDGLMTLLETIKSRCDGIPKG